MGLKRIDMQKAQLTDVGWKLDPHSALYTALNRKSFSCATYTVTQAEAHRPDLVAIKCYGKVEWWWIIAQYNGIINPLRELMVGVTLIIPNYNEVDKMFKQGNTKSRQGQKVEV